MLKDDFQQSLWLLSRTKVNTAFVSAVSKICSEIVKILDWRSLLISIRFELRERYTLKVLAFGRPRSCRPCQIPITETIVTDAFNFV